MKHRNRFHPTFVPSWLGLPGLSVEVAMVELVVLEGELSIHSLRENAAGPPPSIKDLQDIKIGEETASMRAESRLG